MIPTHSILHDDDPADGDQCNRTDTRAQFSSMFGLLVGGVSSKEPVSFERRTIWRWPMDAYGALASAITQAMIPAAHSSRARRMAPIRSPREGPEVTSEVSHESTVDLLERARQGDQGALDALCSRYLVPLRRWARGRLPRWARDIRDTEDLVQDTLLNTLPHLDTFEHRDVGALQAYLREAVMNRVRDECRRIARRPGIASLPDAAPAAELSPLEQAVGAQEFARYDAALARLSAGEREAIVSRIEMGRSYSEIAELLGKPSADAARMTVSRALVRLAKEMRRAT